MLWWWNIVAFVLIFPFAGRYASPMLLGLHLAWGAIVNAFLTVSYAIVPVLLLVGMQPGMETESAYGWPDVARQVEAAQTAHGADFLASNRYQTSSQLAFILDDPDVAALSPRRDAFDDWFDPATRLGQSAIFIEDPTADTDYWRAYFETVREIGDAPAGPWGRVLKTYRLYLAEGFRWPE